MSGILIGIYLVDLLLKKFFLAGFYGEWALPEVASYLFLFFSVGCFLISIMRADDESP